MNNYFILNVINLVCFTSGLQNAVTDSRKQEQSVRPVSPYVNNYNQQQIMPSYTHVTHPGTRLPTYTNTQSLPRPMDQHVLMRPRPVFDADVHFDEDVHYNVYRPMTEHDGFPQIIGDQYMIPRPQATNQHVSNNFANHGNFHFPNNDGPMHASVSNRPNSNTHQPHVLVRPEHFNPIRPSFPLQQENFLHEQGNENQLPLVDNQPMLIKPFLSGKPFESMKKPQLLIFAKNVFINPPSQHGHRPNPSFVGSLTSAIRFDHGRDYHVRPNTALDNIDVLDIPKPPLFNKEVFNNSPKKEVVSKPGSPSKDQNSAVQNSATHQSGQSKDLGRPEINNSSPSTTKSNMAGPEDWFHPLLSPMRTNVP